MSAKPRQSLIEMLMTWSILAATDCNIYYEHAPVSDIQLTYGLADNGNIPLICDVWGCRIGPWWVLWGSVQIDMDLCQQQFGIGVTYHFFVPPSGGSF